MSNPTVIDFDDPLVRVRPYINPYRRAAGLVYSRVRWDLHPESWRSRRMLSAWRDKYLDQKAVILCNGPSLLKCDFGLLNNVFTFGLNKINLLFDQSDFRPSCIVAVNPFVIEQNLKFYNTTGIPLFLDSASSFRRGLQVNPRRNVVFVHSGPPGFARDCSISVHQGATVTYVALQLAFHMGFREVAIVGADHKFATQGPANMLVTSGEKDHSHFDPSYFAGGVPWQLPDLFQSEYVYTQARDVYRAFGRRLINATEGGMLEVFERMPLHLFLSQ
ncbi:DUF115 domain-containing protein [Synechococcus sp. Tobar12-5m-g]|uniref:6-hydroxymethylpterin diphosphokinase MptE-like protein n=1 Tax=unclassified Synechococcus TaxID=2626047 RepID=UPI0020CEACC1|nr:MULTISPECIES: 6-hydroxymethylpterin diphosphokinase MptE-like protein [unclassified Synechococcus]MCP9773650.1 DUF115 domain-containing protein [Synechococcus sp. Tobar12-5m-g]MCP9874623.1 DUF115 domain-containing protein [Synechococcus sp. Cruz CV-v-12]